jgi:hypothetical protein
MKLIIETFDNRSFDVFIEGFYNSSKNGSQKTTDEDEPSNDDEDDTDIAMIDEMLSHDAETSPSPTKST